VSVAHDERVERFYAGVDRDIRLFGADHLGKHNIFVRLARYTANSGIDWSEATRIVARIENLASWYGAWASAAAEFEQMAGVSLERGNRASAGEYLLLASQLYHWSQINVPPGNAQKERGRRQSIAAYRRAAPLLDPPAEPLEIPFAGREMPAYLRVPAGSEPLDLLVLVDGANSVKEELHLWGDALLARGLAVATFDGPGQGEFSPALGGLPMRLREYELAVSAAIDAASERLGTRLRRVGLWGNSFGGFLVARGAAHDPRVRATVSLGGFYDFRDFPRVPLPVQEELRDLMAVPTIDDAVEEMRRSCSLDDCEGRVHSPLLVVHGARDDLVGETEAQALADLSADGELVVLEDGVHCCYNRYLELRPSISDWLARRLRGETARHGSLR
jgi:2,6-dihydroxypseudooxynicotine hydrolase